MKTWHAWFLAIVGTLLSTFIVICPLIICEYFNLPGWLEILLLFWGLVLVIIIFLVSYIMVKGHEKQ